MQAMTVDQMTETVRTFRGMCQPKFKVTDGNDNMSFIRTYIFITL